jgi:hypothetical protein
MLASGPSRQVKPYVGLSYNHKLMPGLLAHQRVKGVVTFCLQIEQERLHDISVVFNDQYSASCQGTRL